jgi:hypothetical protein
MVYVLISIANSGNTSALESSVVAIEPWTRFHEFEIAAQGIVFVTLGTLAHPDGHKVWVDDGSELLVASRIGISNPDFYPI